MIIWTLTPSQNRTFFLRSRSFLNRVNDRLRKILDHSSEDAMQDIDKRSMICGIFYVIDIGSICIHGKELHSIKNTKDPTMKQMFDISEKLILEQSDEICGVKTMNWEDSSWECLSLIGDEEVIRFSHAKVHVFSDSVLRLGTMNEN